MPRMGDMWYEALRKLNNGEQLSNEELEAVRFAGNNTQATNDFVGGLQNGMSDINAKKINANECEFSGDVLIGRTVGSSPNMFWNASEGILQFRQGVYATSETSATRAFSGIGAKVYRENSQSIPNTGLHNIVWEYEAYDDVGFVDLVADNTKFTIPTGYDGRYEIIARGAFATNATNWRIMQLMLNGASYDADVKLGNANFGTLLFCHTEIDLSATDYIQIQLYQNSGDALVFSGAPIVEEQPFCFIRRVR